MIRKPIPISAAERIAKSYGYDQVIIIARRVGDGDDHGGEHVTTYGKNSVHCSIAATVGKFITSRIMQWEEARKT